MTDWPFTLADLGALQAAYDALTRVGNLTADSAGGWDYHLDRAHHHVALVLTHSTVAMLRFEEAYAARSGVTVAQLHANGRYAEPCNCGQPDCCGWAMGHQHEEAIAEEQLRTRFRPWTLHGTVRRPG